MFAALYLLVCFLWATIATKIGYERGDFNQDLKLAIKGNERLVMTFLINFIGCPIALLVVLYNGNITFKK